MKEFTINDLLFSFWYKIRKEDRRKGIAPTQFEELRFRELQKLRNPNLPVQWYRERCE